jgi:cyclopropane fatty-acyl-phospholipid synthase-like methyltransferase
MAKQPHVCPWWIGYLLASPLRRILQNPDKILAPYVRPGMTVLEPGPGMGFFTIPIARMVGANGCVHVLDVQEEMLSGLERRAKKAGVSSRIHARLVQPDSMDITDLIGKVDLVCAFALVHEMPSSDRFFSEASAALRPDGLLLLAEPAGHVSSAEFEAELEVANRHGLRLLSRPTVRRSQAAVLKKA